MKKALLVPIAALLAAGSCFAQEARKQYVIGEWHELESKVLKEKRSFVVSKPLGYDEDDKKYAVIFLLDGESHFQHTNGVVTFMSMRGLMPPAIVVAVSNTERTRDMTPPTSDSDSFPTAGGADNFLKFFEEELIPYVDDNFRTQPYRMIIGHSYGGLFAVHALVTRPEVFDSYIAISPSLWWDDQKIVDEADKFFESKKELKKSIYLTMGDEGGAMVGGLLKLTGVLSEHKPKGFEWDSRVMEEENHGTIPYRSTRQGLYFVFDDWQISDLVACYDEGGGVQGVFNRAKAISEKFGIERPVDGGDLLFLSWKLAEAGRPTESLAVLEYDTKKYPPASRFYAALGDKFLAADDEEKAKHCFTEALKLDPKSDVARKALKKLGVDPDTIAKPPPSRQLASS